MEDYSKEDEADVHGYAEMPDKENGLKRPNRLREAEVLKKRLKKSNIQNIQISNSTPNGNISLDDEEEDTSTNPLAFDNLLEKLGLLNKKRQLEKKMEGYSKEDEAAVHEYSEMSDKENGSKSSLDGENVDGIGDKEDISSKDDVTNSDKEDQTEKPEKTSNTSSFHRHMERIITNDEVKKLDQSKWKYKWELPAIASKKSKWVGTGDVLSMEHGSDSVYGIKSKLYKHWVNIHKASGFADMNPHLRLFFSFCDSYRDIMHCNKKPFYLKGEEDSAIMDAYLMHALNHIFKTRNIVSKNNAKLAKVDDNEDKVILDDGYLDQGYTRPKVLFLLPFRSIALRVVNRLVQLVPASYKSTVEHMDQFVAEYGEGVDEQDEDFKAKKTPKPKDFDLLFGGNNNDHFMVGIKLTKRSIKLYNDFYTSDIIVASPLALITKLGEAETTKEKDVDYLSSIEVLVIDHADVIAMQNWSHLNTIVEQLNRLPTETSRSNIFRIRQWYLDQKARYYRQTILLGSYINPDMNALFDRSCLNYEGKVKLVSEYDGVLAKVPLQVKQVYERITEPSILKKSSLADVDNTRFCYFCEKLFPKLKDSTEGGIMLFVSSYFEYVRIRRFLKSQEASFCMFGDYTDARDISRARTLFFKGEQKIMLYTERAHFYYRYKIKGIKNLIIYSLPERKDFYAEIVNMIQESRNMTCHVLFSSVDRFRLERIVGSSSANKMLSSDKKVFVFC